MMRSEPVRRSRLEDFNHHVSSSTSRINFVTGPPGSGKSHSLRPRSLRPRESGSLATSTFHLYSTAAASLDSASRFSEQLWECIRLSNGGAQKQKEQKGSQNEQSDIADALVLNKPSSFHNIVFEEASDFFRAFVGIGDLSHDTDREEAWLRLGMVREAIENVGEELIVRRDYSTDTSTGEPSALLPRLFFVVEGRSDSAIAPTIDFFTPNCARGRGDACSVFAAPAPLDWASRLHLATSLLRSGQQEDTGLAEHFARETGGFVAGDMEALWRLAVLRSCEEQVGEGGDLGPPPCLRRKDLDFVRRTLEPSAARDDDAFLPRTLLDQFVTADEVSTSPAEILARTSSRSPFLIGLDRTLVGLDEIKSRVETNFVFPSCRAPRGKKTPKSAYGVTSNFKQEMRASLTSTCSMGSSPFAVM